MTERPERPEFATAIRGYDKLQVDDYIDRMIEITADAEERAGTAEAELEFSRHTTVGPRVGQIFELAVQEAQDLRERVGQEAEQTRTRARREADETTAHARKAASETEAEAERKGKETIARAGAVRDKVLREVEALGEKKAWLLADLDRLQQVLAAATRAATRGPAEGDETAQAGGMAKADEPGESRGPRPKRGQPAARRQKQPADSGRSRGAVAKQGAGQSRARASR